MSARSNRSAVNEVRPPSTKSMHRPESSKSARPTSSKSARPVSSRSARPSSSRTVPSFKALVTGGSGYISLHVIDLLLKEGHRVRTTVRSLANSEKCDPIKACAKNPDMLELVEADLLNPDCWNDACKDIDVVFHVASPFPIAPPENEDDVVKPAVDGTLNVLKAAAEVGVKRVVLTSSCLACFPEKDPKGTYDHDSWASADETSGYQKSKILAERAAWEFVKNQKDEGKPVFEFCTVLPSLVMGPVLSKFSGEQATSSKYFLTCFQSGAPPAPIMNMCLPFCDVRDVAFAHYRAAIFPEANGQRFIVTTRYDWPSFVEIRKALADEFNPKGMNIQLEPVQDASEPPKNKEAHLDNSKMIEFLKLPPTPFEKTLVDMANSFIELGLAKCE